MSGIFEIRHSLEYRYSEPVFLEPHTLFLRPRSDASQTVLDFQLDILPAPSLQSEKIDLFGNNPGRVWFQGASCFLKVSAVSRVEINRDNPFSYFMDESCLRLPLVYQPEFNAVLLMYRMPLESHPSVAEYAENIARDSGFSTGDFLLALCADIQKNFTKLKREEGPAFSPSRTLAQKQGACRDLAVLFMEACRMQGLAARFTSGYFEGLLPDGGDSHELHAWAEVYLQGGGWRGYDPTAGIAVAGGHIAVASGPENYSMAPVQGTFRGPRVESFLNTSVTVRRFEGAQKSAK